MKKVNGVRKVTAIVVLMAALVIPVYTPVTNVVPGAPRITTVAKAEAKAVMSKKKAKKKLKKWLKKKGLWNSNLIVVYDRTDGYEYVFWAYFDEGDHTATQNWYYVDARTGSIRAEF